MAANGSFRAFLVFCQSSAYIKVTWFYVPSDEALLLRRPATRAPNQPENFSKPDCPFSHVRDAHVAHRGSQCTQGNTMTIGTVKFFNTSKGFGFIAPDDGGKDVFVHATAVEAAGLRSLNEGQKVSFDIQPDARGSKAANLKAV
jgi:CspA family cold shock protein